GGFPYDVFGPVRRTLDNIVNAPVRPPSAARGARDRWPGLGPAVDAIVLKALAKAPARRHASAAELAEELRACAAGEVRPAGRPRYGRRMWGIAGALLGMACALVVAASVRPPASPSPSP